MQMYRVAMEHETSLDEFRTHVRALIANKVAPDDVAWTTADNADLFGEDVPPAQAAKFTVPSTFVELARHVLHHRDPERFALLYRLIWRLLQGERDLLAIFSDTLVYRLRAMEKSVGRDLHKMTAFLRFREVADDGGDHFVAWFEPQHLILRPAAEFFVKRFAAMRFTVLTPDGTIQWDRKMLSFGPGVPKSTAPTADTLEDWWKSYYRSTFNPARVNPKMMKTEMPVRYWKNLPEAELIPDLLASARTRAAAMIAAPPTAPRPGFFLQDEPEVMDTTTLEGLRAQARRCQRCPLHCHATQTVFGEGPADAPVAFVGEQPGDQEDLAGKPFVGPAGQVFDRAMIEAALDRSRVYVTNAVKHFKFAPRGKKRTHQKPNDAEIEQCRWWLDLELMLVKPKLIVAMGATAARALTGKTIKITDTRGRIMSSSRGGPTMLVTVHPSYLLRLPGPAAQRMEYARFVDDLRLVAEDVAAVRRAA
jgi:DNA polymerase